MPRVFGELLTMETTERAVAKGTFLGSASTCGLETLILGGKKKKISPGH